MNENEDTAAPYLSTDALIGGVSLVSVYDFGGQLFLNALKTQIVSLIVSSIALAAAVAARTGLDAAGLKA